MVLVKVEELTEEEKELVRLYVTSVDSNVFCVHGLSGIVGGAYARYSRAKGGFRKTFAKEFVKEGKLDVKRSRDLLNRVLIQFGDDSVGELEGAHLSVEGISNLATKVIEDRRIGGSPIEQSSRYVFYDERLPTGNFKYLKERRIMESRFVGDYIKLMDLAFQTYVELIEPMQEFFRRLKPLEQAEYDIRGSGEKIRFADTKDEKERKAFRTTHNLDIRTKACDTIRVLLPAATLTNVGIFGNGRFFQHMLTKLYSHPLEEMHDIAIEAHEALNYIIPDYVKRAARSDYLVENDRRMQELTDKLFANKRPWESIEVELLENSVNSHNFTNYLVAQMLFPYSEHPIRQLRDIVGHLTKEERQLIIDTYVGNRKTRRDRPERALEFGYPINFELVGNFGIYRDLHRHRILTQMRQGLTTRLGFFVPDEIKEARFGDIVLRVADKSADLYEKLKTEGLREEAQYVVLFGHNIRWYMGMNFREAMHMWELRTIPQGHPSYRRMCQEMHRLTSEKYPELANTMKFVDYNDYFWSRAESEARQRARERQLGLSQDE